MESKFASQEVLAGIEPTKGKIFGRTVLESLAQPVDDFNTNSMGPQAMRSTHTQERTFDTYHNHPDSRPDVIAD